MPSLPNIQPTLPYIQGLIDENRLDEAMSALDVVIAANPADDKALTMRGKLHWRMQAFHRAVTDFEGAVDANPESEARHALEVARDVFNFYNPDLLNP